MSTISYASYTTVDDEPSEILRRVEEAGFDGFEVLSEGRHDLRDEGVVQDFIEMDTDLVLTVHAPISDMNFATLNDELWRVVVGQLERVVEGTAEIGAERVTFHPGHYSPIGKRYPEMAEERNLEALKCFVEKGEEVGVDVGVENLASVDVFMGRTLDELEEMASAAGMDVTLDIGHAFLEGELDSFLERPDLVGHVHVHDNGGERDEHLEIGEGEIAFEGDVAEFLKGVGSVFVIEGRSLEEAERSLRRLRGLVG